MARMSRPTCICVLAVLLCIVAVVSGAEPATAEATADAKAQATGGGTANAAAASDAKVDSSKGASASATGSSSASASAGADGKPAVKVNPEIEKAFKDYVSKCDGDRYDPKKTTPGECGGLSGGLCSRKDVKCYADKTDFLDASGAVIATGTHKDMRICYKGGECKAA